MIYKYLLLFSIAFMIIGCNHDRNNPFDPGATNHVMLIVPQDFTGQPITPTSIKLNWNGSNTRTDGYVVLRGLSENMMSVYAVLGVNRKSFIDTNCLPYTVYYYKAGAFDKLNDTAYEGNTIRVRTLYRTPLDMPVVPLLSPPSGFFIERNSATTVKLSWLETGLAGIKGVILEKGLNPGNIGYLIHKEDTTRSIIDSISSDLAIYYSLRKFDTTYFGVSSAIIDSVKPFVRPEQLKLNFSTDNIIHVSWKGTESNTDSICLEKKSGTNSWSNRVRLPRGATVFSDSAISSYTTFYYRAYSFSGTEKTPYSNQDSVFLPGVLPPSADTSTLLCWNFDEISGSTVLDDSKYHRNGVFQDSIRVAGKFGRAIFLKDSSYVTSSIPMDFSGTSLSVEFWIKPWVVLDSLTDRTGLMMTINGPITIYYYHGRIIADFVAYGNVVHSVFADCSFSPNKWSQIMVVFSNNKIKIYVNCVLVGMQPANFTTILTAAGLYFGKAKILNMNKYYDGYVDGLRIKNNPDEIFK